MHIDLNCDMGEGIGNDEAIMPFITSANIACGFHAGDEQTMRSTILLAKKHCVHIGAHPSFLDRENFGRTEMFCSNEEVYKLVQQQLHTLKTIADDCEVVIHHVKPHGALYNMAARDQHLAEAICRAVKDFDERLVIYGLSNSHIITVAKKMGLSAWQEVFGDRTYQADGSLTPRSHPGALIENEEAAVGQFLQMIQTQTVTTVNGGQIPIYPETVCLHGDGKHAVAFARSIHTALHKFSS